VVVPNLDKSANWLLLDGHLRIEALKDDGVEQELASLQEGISSIQDTYGQDHLHLTVIKAYVRKLLGNARVVRYLMQTRPEFLSEFQTIAEMDSVMPAEAEESARRT
jgi:hypothetical protein